MELDHGEDSKLTTSEVAGLICGVVFGFLALTFLVLVLLKRFDPRAWNRMIGCFRAISHCNLDGPENPDEPIKARDPEDPDEEDHSETPSYKGDIRPWCEVKDKDSNASLTT